MKYEQKYSQPVVDALKKLEAVLTKAGYVVEEIDLHTTATGMGSFMYVNVNEGGKLAGETIKPQEAVSEEEARTSLQQLKRDFHYLDVEGQIGTDCRDIVLVLSTLGYPEETIKKQIWRYINSSKGY